MHRARHMWSGSVIEKILSLGSVLIILFYRAGVISNTLTLWKNEWQFTASSRDELENTTPEAICTLRPERLHEGEARGQSRGVVFSNASFPLAVYYYNVALREEMYCKLHTKDTINCQGQ